jgi:DNA-binding transcriptional LysR family regulator
MELYQLRTFLVVAAERSVTRAARRLLATPPSVSGHIKALEDEWNVPLFRRTAGGMEITEKGEELRVKAEATLLAAQDLANHATNLRGLLMGTVRIGINCSAELLRVPALVTRMREACPGVELQIVQYASGRIVKELMHGSLEAGFIFGQSGEQLTAHRLTAAELVVSAPCAWEPDIRAATWETLASLPWIRSSGDCPFQHAIDRMFEEAGLEQRIAVSADDDTTRAELVAAGVGIALLERSDARRAVATGSVIIWQSEPILCDLSFAYLASRRDDPLVRALRLTVLDLWELVIDSSLPARRHRS